MRPHPTRRSSARRSTVVLLATAACVALSGCSGSDGDGGTASTASGSPGAPAAAPLLILVTNDDGVAADGIAALATRLRALPGVTVQVVAPAENQSGSGGKTTPGDLPPQPAKTADGGEATSVAGYPADAVRVALDTLRLTPALVVSGVNKGQNVGPLTAISGTVGAARAAATRGIPAIAVSSGKPATTEDYDYDVGADLAVKEAEKLLPALRAGQRPDTSTVVNLNVPSCDTGAVRGLQELPPNDKPDGRVLEASDCTSTAAPSDEVTSYLEGFAVLTRVPSRV